MSSRAERRRASRTERKTQKRPATDTEPLFDVIINASPPSTVEGLVECAGSLPTERRTVTAITHADIDSIEEAKAIPGWRRPVRAGNLTAARILAASRGRASFVVFIDADCRLQEPEMLDLALAHLAQGAGVVGGLLVDGDKVFTAGYYLAITGQPMRRYAGWSPENERVQMARHNLQAMPFTFLATKRAVLKKVQLRPDFGAMSYGDVDYCIRVHHAGARVIYDPAIRAETAGTLTAERGPEASAGVQLMVASSRPVYDEWAVV